VSVALNESLSLEPAVVDWIEKLPLKLSVPVAPLNLPVPLRTVARPFTVTGDGAALLTAHAWVLDEETTRNLRPLGPASAPAPEKGSHVLAAEPDPLRSWRWPVGAGTGTPDCGRLDAGAAPEQSDRAGVTTLEGDVDDLGGRLGRVTRDNDVRRSAWRQHCARRRTHADRGQQTNGATTINVRTGAPIDLLAFARFSI